MISDLNAFGLLLVLFAGWLWAYLEDETIRMRNRAAIGLGRLLR